MSQASHTVSRKQAAAEHARKSKGINSTTTPGEQQTQPIAKADGELRLLSKGEVLERVGVSFPSLWKWMNAGKFPRSRELGGKSAWLEHEVNAWILARPITRLKCDGPS